MKEEMPQENSSTKRRSQTSGLFYLIPGLIGGVILFGLILLSIYIQSIRQPIKKEAKEGKEGQVLFDERPISTSKVKDVTIQKKGEVSRFLSDEELTRLPQAVKNIDSGFLSLQTIQAKKKSGFLFAPVFAADRLLSRIVVFERGPRPRDIYQYDLESSAQEQLTSDNVDDYNPVISSDSQLAYASVIGETPKINEYSGSLIIQIKVKNVLTGEVKKLTEEKQLGSGPFLSPRGKFLAITNDFNYITTFNLNDSSSRKYLVTSKASSSSNSGAMAWSEDEGRIIFQMTGNEVEGGKTNLSIAELDLGSGTFKMVSDILADESLPQYVQSDKISYLQDRGGERGAFYENFVLFDRTTQKKQVFSLTSDVYPGYLWSPDFNRVYFITRDGYVSVLNVSTGEYQVVTTTDTFDGIVGWGIQPEALLLHKLRYKDAFPCYDISMYTIANGQTPVRLFDTCSLDR